MQGDIRWLFLPGEPRTQSDDFGHGTCVTSKVASPTFGVAKTANLVIVKLYPINGHIATSRVITAWAVVAHDIASNNMQGSAVVSIALNGEQSRC